MGQRQSCLTLESLLDKNNLSEAQVNVKIRDHDVLCLAHVWVDEVEDCNDNKQSTDIRDRSHSTGSCSLKAAKMLLNYWKYNNPHQATNTFKALIEFLLEGNNTTAAWDVCKYVKKLKASRKLRTSQRTKTISIIIAAIATVCVLPMVLVLKDSLHTAVPGKLE